MKLRELIASIHVPYRNVAFGVMILGSLTLAVFQWCFIRYDVPPNLYWTSYLAILLMFIGIMYLIFWIYKAGYKKRALLLAILYIAVFTLSTIVITWALDSYTETRLLLP